MNELFYCQILCKSPTLSNLWNYHSHFYQQTNDLQKQNYLFEDLAGIYTKDGKSSLFAVCIEYPNKKDLVVLPSGTYICANCSEEDREDILKKLLNTIKQKYEKSLNLLYRWLLFPNFAVELPNTNIFGRSRRNRQLKLKCKKRRFSNEKTSSFYSLKLFL